MVVAGFDIVACHSVRFAGFGLRLTSDNNSHVKARKLSLTAIAISVGRSVLVIVLMIQR